MERERERERERGGGGGVLRVSKLEGDDTHSSL